MAKLRVHPGGRKKGKSLVTETWDQVTGDGVSCGKSSEDRVGLRRERGEEAKTMGGTTCSKDEQKACCSHAMSAS